MLRKYYQTLLAGMLITGDNVISSRLLQLVCFTSLNHYCNIRLNVEWLKNQKILMFPPLFFLSAIWERVGVEVVAPCRKKKKKQPACGNTDSKYIFCVFLSQSWRGGWRHPFQLLFTSPNVCKEPNPWKLFLLSPEPAQGNNCLNETCFDEA